MCQHGQLCTVQQSLTKDALQSLVQVVINVLVEWIMVISAHLYQQVLTGVECDYI